MGLQNYDAAKVMGRHAGLPAWVIGGGPSLLHQDPAEMLGAVVFVVNQHVETAPELGFPMADYWVFIDLECPLNHGHLFERPPGRYPEPVKICDPMPGAFLMGRGFEPGGDGRGRYFLPVTFAQSWRPRPDDTVPCAKASSLSGALHLAVMMGCNPIHIRGLDLQNGPHGRVYWNDQPGAGAPNEPNYDFQRDYLHCVIQEYVTHGVRIDVKGASWLATEPYVPYHLRPAPAGELCQRGA
jgi:hypothetical protein